MNTADDQPTLADEIAAVANIKRQHGWDSAEIVESCWRMAEEWKTGNEGGRSMTAVATHFDFCGERWPRDPQDIARDQWIAERLPVVVAAMEQQDDQLVRAFDDVIWNRKPAVLDAYRANDAGEFLRLVRELVGDELACDAEMQLDEEAFARFPESDA